MNGSIRVNTGSITLEVNDQGETICFAPDDLMFMEKFQQLNDDVGRKQEEFVTRAENLTEDSGKEAVSLLKEVCEFCSEKIDYVFGIDTCRKVFGSAMQIDMYTEFLEQITPFVQKVRKEKMKKYKK